MKGGLNREMKFFRKISAVAASALMLGLTMGTAAAANYPAPFVVGNSADVAIVYGSTANYLDGVQANDIKDKLEASMSGTAGGTPTGGDSVLIAKSSDNLNINETLSGVYTGTVTDDNLKTLLADGVYIAGDNDEFDYEQKITLGSPELRHFRDSDYESLAGLTERTPVIGFKIASNTYVLNYTLEFLEDVTSDVTSSRMEDIEGSDLPLMGRTYYVSELQNGSEKS